MKAPKRMRPEEAWVLVRKSTGRIWHRKWTKPELKKHLHPILRLARVRITEVKRKPRRRA